MIFKPKLFLFIIITVFISLSFYISTNKPFWRDEIFSFYISDQSLVQIIHATAQDFSPPLFYLLLHPLIKMFGPHQILLRILPLFFSIATIFLFYYIAISLKLKSYRFILFLLINSFSFPLLYFSTELRAYSLQMFLALLSLLIAHKFLGNPSKIRLLLFSIINLLLLYTHTTAIFFIAAQSISIIFYCLIRHPSHFRKIISSYFLTLLFFSPWLRIIITQSNTAQSSFWINLTRPQMLREFHGLYYIVEHLPTPLKNDLNLTNFYYLSLFLTFSGLIILLKKYSKTLFIALSFLLTLAIFYLYSIKISQVLYHRYLSFLTPITTILISSNFIFLTSQKKIRLIKSSLINNLKIILLIIFFSYFVYSSFINYQYLISRPSKNNFFALSKINQPLFTSSQTRLLPCNFHHHNCTFIGDLDKIPKFIGISQLNPNLFKTLPLWSDINLDSFYIFYSHNLNPSVLDQLEKYQPGHIIDVGNNQKAQRFSLN